MKLIHIDTDDLANPLRGGQPVRTFEVSSRIAGRHHITVLTSSFSGSDRSRQRGNIEYRRLGITIPRFGLSSHLSFLSRLRSVVRSQPHDIIVEEFTPPFGFVLTPWFTKKPVVSIVQWFFFDEWQRRYGLPFEKIMRAIGRRGRYRNLIVQTESMRRYFSELLPDARIWTLGCGVSEDLFRAPGGDGDYVLFLGRLAIEQKGLDLLIEAWTEIHRQGVTIPLKIAGEGPARAWLEAEIAARGLGDCITLVGRQEGAGKQQILHECAFVVVPSREETFGIVPLEAMASAKPVVAFDIEHMNELLRPEWAILAGKPDAAALAAAVLRMWRDPDGRAAMAARAYEAAQSRRWDEIARQQEAIYLEVAGVGATGFDRVQP